MDLIERVELAAKIIADIGGQSLIAATIGEAAAELRRVREAPVVEVTAGEDIDPDDRVIHTYGLVSAMVEVQLIGQRVRLVPVIGEEG